MGENTYSWNEVQKEVMQEAAEYLTRLIPAAEELKDEFCGELKEDSYDYLNMVVEGLNWVIQVYNGTKDEINSGTEQINSAEMDKKISAFGSAVISRNQQGIAKSLTEDVLPFLRKMKEIADTAC
ncbi:MAG: hypothetical protein J6K26_01825 [Lachnospiraceae bacterium]|nr:hypothetical protein [Lachnospiraceae bacterium]